MTPGETVCPSCGRTNELHDAADGAAPEVGDVSICWACREPAIFTAYGLRAPTPEERAEVEASPEVRAVLAAARESYTPAQSIDLLRGGGS